ncbi:MAG: hypothetical protein M1816_002804 [Peltula sp. TS41687]|nr:MAG: hypothetical protein M1816_002804 [Peltula sp. TS41687]
MPLVVPGINNNTDDAQMEWANKLLGKKLSETTHDSTSFARKDLPKEHRVIEHGSMVTQDHKPDRLNVHLDKDGTIHHVDFK